MPTPHRFAVVLVALAAVTAACGRSDGGNPAALIAAVPDRVADAGSARFTMEMTMRSQDLPGGSATITGDGQGRFDRQLMQMTMDMGDVLQGMPGAADNGSVEMILDGDMMYMRMPFLEPMLPAGKRWVAMDLETVGKQAGVDLRALMQASQNNDPSSTLEMLRGVSEGDVEVVGQDNVRGVSTTHYRATIDLDKALEAAPEDGADQIRALVQQAGVPNRLPVEVWIDDDGLLRRYVQTIEMTVEGTDQPIGQSLTMEMFDYGVQVDVERPPAEQTIDVRELTRPAA